MLMEMGMVKTADNGRKYGGKGSGAHLPHGVSLPPLGCASLIFGLGNLLELKQGDGRCIL